MDYPNRGAIPFNLGSLLDRSNITINMAYGPFRLKLHHRSPRLVGLGLLGI